MEQIAQWSVVWRIVHPDVTVDLESLDATLTTVEKVVDLEELRRRIDELEMQASDPELWNNQDHAQKVTSELACAVGVPEGERTPAAARGHARPV